MARMMETEVFPALPASLHSLASTTTRTLLRARWFWKDWFVVVYNPVSGYKNHFFSGWDVKGWFRRQVNGGKINIVIKWVDRERPSSGKSTRTKKFTITSPGGPLVGPISRTFLPEDYSWSDSRDIKGHIDPENSHPGLIWACRRYKGVHAAWNNSGRTLWKVGKEFTIAIYR